MSVDNGDSAQREHAADEVREVVLDMLREQQQERIEAGYAEDPDDGVSEHGMDYRLMVDTVLAAMNGRERSDA